MRYALPSPKSVQVNDVTLAYMERGEGEPLFLIMGLWGSMDLWDPRLVEALARRFRVITFDNRGIGYSTSSEQEYSIELFARDTVELIEALGYEKANVLGWSMGANVAMELGIRYPHRVDKLVLYAGNCGGPESEPSSPVIEGMLSSDNLTKEMVVKSMFPEWWNMEHPDIEEYCPQVRNATPDENLERQLKADERWPGCHDRASAIRAPTLIVNGTEDLDCPEGNAILLAGLILSSRLACFPEAGHGLMYQCPESLAEVVLEFLDEPSARGA